MTILSVLNKCLRETSLTIMNVSIQVLQLPWTLISGFVIISFSIFLFIKAIVYDLSKVIKEFSEPNLKPVGSEDKSSSNLPPIVLVHGVFGFGEGRMGGMPYFGGVEKKYERVFVPDLGSLTSIHDRARQLFYYLKGGQVDYGEEHSKAFGHSQFGRVYKQGRYQEWDEDHPIHFIGHSAGAQVVRVLHQMLADKAFKGYENTCEKWVLSVNAICGAFNGSTRTYITGIKPEDWRSTQPWSQLQLCKWLVILYDWMEISWVKSYYNFGFDHFNLSWRKIGFSGLIDCLMGKKGPFASGDWILPDLTIQGSMEINSKISTFPKTFYTSYATKRTTTQNGKTRPSGLLKINPWFYIQVREICLWRYPTNIPPPYHGYRDEDWQDNDGELNTVSMKYPWLPNEHPNIFVSDDSEFQPQPGIWYHKVIEADHFQFVLNLDNGVLSHKVFDNIFKHCKALPTSNNCIARG